MSLERVIKALIGLGLSRLDSQVYVYLAKIGPSKSIEIAQELKVQIKKIQSSLDNLQDKEIVRALDKHLDQFIAVPFEEALNLLLEIKRDQAESLRETRKELVASWNKMTKKPNDYN